MVQPSRVDSLGHRPVLLFDARLRGPSGFGAGPVLEAWRMVFAVGTKGFISGYFIHGIVPCKSPAAPSPTTRPLLLSVLCQICLSASDCHGVCTWTGSLFYTQKEEGLETILSTSLKHLIRVFKTWNVHLMYSMGTDVDNDDSMAQLVTPKCFC